MQEAKLFFTYDSSLEIDDAWDEHFFAKKQYFLTHVPIPKVWHSKLHRLNKENEAYLVLSNQQPHPVILKNKEEERLVFPEDFIAAFHLFHQHRNRYKTRVAQAFEIATLTEIIQKWLSMETQYAKYWEVQESEQLQVMVAQSKEPDPMEWLALLQSTQQHLSSNNIHILKRNFKKLSEEFKKEVKRLTLLAKN